MSPVLPCLRRLRLQTVLSFLPVCWSEACEWLLITVLQKASVRYKLSHELLEIIVSLMIPSRCATKHNTPTNTTNTYKGCTETKTVCFAGILFGRNRFFISTAPGGKILHFFHLTRFHYCMLCQDCMASATHIHSIPYKQVKKMALFCNMICIIFAQSTLVLLSQNLLYE